jgi:hypothetical protein
MNWVENIHHLIILKSHINFFSKYNFKINCSCWEGKKAKCSQLFEESENQFQQVRIWGSQTFWRRHVMQSALPAWSTKCLTRSPQAPLWCFNNSIRPEHTHSRSRAHTLPMYVCIFFEHPPTRKLIPHTNVSTRVRFAASSAGCIQSWNILEMCSRKIHVYVCARMARAGSRRRF